MPKLRSILGIDLRVTSVKLVEIVNEQGKFTLKNWGMAEIPSSLLDKHPEKEDAQADALKKLIQANKIKTKDAAVVVGGGESFVKILNLSEVAKGEARDAVKWKLAEEIPFPIEEAVFDYYPLTSSPESGPESEYLAACIDTDIYRNIDRVIKRAGLKLTSVTIIPDALHRIFEAGILKDKGKVVSLIYMGKRTTNISIIKDNRIVFNRELNIGGENITLAMSGVLVSPEGRVDVSPEQAEKIKVEHGIPIDVAAYPKISDIPITQLQAMVRPALERIQDEIMRSFEYYKGQTGEASVDKIILTGGSAMTGNLAKFISEGVGIPVETPKLTEGLQIDPGIENKTALEKISPRLSAAIGSALVANEKINLIPDEIKHRWELAAQEILKPQYMIVAYLIFLFIFYMAFWTNAFVLRNIIAGIDKKLVEYKPRIEVLGVMERTVRAQDRRKLALQLQEEERTKIPLIFEEISRIIPKSVIIKTINISSGNVRIWGVAFEIGDTAENVLSKFVLSLSSSSYFSGVEMIQASKNNNYVQDAFDFEISAKVDI